MPIQSLELQNVCSNSNPPTPPIVSYPSRKILQELPSPLIVPAELDSAYKLRKQQASIVDTRDMLNYFLKNAPSEKGIAFLKTVALVISVAAFCGCIGSGATLLTAPTALFVLFVLWLFASILGTGGTFAWIINDRLEQRHNSTLQDKLPLDQQSHLTDWLGAATLGFGAPLIEVYTREQRMQTVLSKQKTNLQGAVNAYTEEFNNTRQATTNFYKENLPEIERALEAMIELEEKHIPEVNSATEILKEHVGVVSSPELGNQQKAEIRRLKTALAEVRSAANFHNLQQTAVE